MRTLEGEAWENRGLDMRMNAVNEGCARGQRLLGEKAGGLRAGWPPVGLVSLWQELPSPQLQLHRAHRDVLTVPSFCVFPPGPGVQGD